MKFVIKDPVVHPLEWHYVWDTDAEAVIMKRYWRDVLQQQTTFREKDVISLLSSASGYISQEFWDWMPDR